MYEIYKIKNGDTLESIADMYDTTVGVLNQINGVLINGIGSNSEIIVPVKKVQPYKYYTVKKGDNMYEIAKNNDIDYSLLLQLNGLDDGDYIYPNQTIMLPRDGYNIYMTMVGDTLKYLLNKMNVTIDDLLNENENIYLLPEQILVFRKK